MARNAAANGAPVRVCLIGAGKFGSMFLSQVPTTEGIDVVCIVDLSPERAKTACRNVGWDEDDIARTAFVEGWDNLPSLDEIDVVVEATGNPAAGVYHARKAIAAGKHIVMVNVEADVLAGPLLAKLADDKGVVYSLAYGDQPALICEMVDWARSCGFDIAAAGKGTRYLPSFHESTPDTVWANRGVAVEDAKKGGMNAQMFNSFIDGTKSGIEMAAVSNATGLRPSPEGLFFPPCSAEELAETLQVGSHEGGLHHHGQVEVVSSVYRDGSVIPNNIRWGVYVVFKAPNEYTKRCFKEYGVTTDKSGEYAALHRPFHLIGLELNVSIFAAFFRGEATGKPTAFVADVVATAKKDLRPGDVLDGEGGFMVWGRLMPAADSLSIGGLPIGLASHLKLTRPVAKGAALTWDDVEIDEADETYKFRRAMELEFSVSKEIAS
jgi:predicted homoserine dehydrogenase-like protein